MLDTGKVTNKKFQIVVIKMPTELGRRMDKHSGSFNKELENIRKNHRKLKNTITEIINNVLQGINSRSDNTRTDHGNHPVRTAKRKKIYLRIA